VWKKLQDQLFNPGVESRYKGNTYDNESVGLVVQHAQTSTVGKANWIIDSGTTTHMCNEQSTFVVYKSMETPTKVILGDGYIKSMPLEVELLNLTVNCQMDQSY